MKVTILLEEIIQGLLGIYKTLQVVKRGTKKKCSSCYTLAPGPGGSSKTFMPCKAPTSRERTRGYMMNNFYRVRFSKRIVFNCTIICTPWSPAKYKLRVFAKKKI